MRLRSLLRAKFPKTAPAEQAHLPARVRPRRRRTGSLHRAFAPVARPDRLLLAWILAAATSLALNVSPALAITTHVFATSFGAAASSPANPNPLSNPTDVAVDNSSGPSGGDIYVTDPANHRVEKFSPSGQFILMFGGHVDQTTGENVCAAGPGNTCQAGTSGSAPGEFETPAFIAVDDSSGDVYVGDRGSGVVSKFDSSGNLIPTWGTEGQLTGFSPLEGIAVDPSRNLFIEQSERTFWYEQSGTLHSSFSENRGTAPAGIAVDAEDHLYKVDGSPEVSMFTVTGSEIAEPDVRSDAVGLTVDPSTNDLYVVQSGEGGLINHYALNCGQGCTPLDSFGGGDLSSPQGIAISATSGDAYVANTGAGTVAVFAPGVIPTVNPVSDLTQTSVTLNGEVEPASGEEITACVFEYGTDTSYSLSSAGCSPAPPYSNSTAVSTELAGLRPETTYHYRIVATEAGGTEIGQDNTFTTKPAVAGLTTGSASGITPTNATLTGSYNGEGLDTSYDFEYGTTTAYGETTATEDNGSAAGPQAVTPIEIDGLQPETTYHYRIVATNTLGSTPGQDNTFTTEPAVAGLATGSASGITPTNATLTGSYNGEGLDTSYDFEYGTTTAYGETTATEDNGSAAGPQAVTPIEIDGLQPETTYHYRIVATNTLGSTPGQDNTFTTEPAVAGLTTGSASGITPTNATLTGSYNGEGLDTSYDFEYGTTTAYGETTATEDNGSAAGPQAVSTEITGLQAYTTYHYRVVATNSLGTAVGEDETVRTAPPYVPMIDATFSSAVTQDIAMLNAQINPGGGQTLYRFQYGTDTSYGSSTPISDPIGSDDSDHAVSAEVSDLTPGTTYHYRAVAINFGGTTHGPDQTFTTTDLPGVAATSVSSASQTTAILTAQINPELAATTYHFEYGVTAAYGVRTPESGPIASDKSEHSASATIAALAPGTTYHYRVVATNAVGTTDGPDQTFITTAPLGEVVPPPVRKCRAGFIRRHGKCMKKPHKRTKHPTTKRRERGHDHG